MEHAPRDGLPEHPNHVTGLPFLYKERAFRLFATRLDEEMCAAGYDDVEAFMQGSTAAGYKHDGVKLDAKGELPSDYDVAIVSPKLLARARELGLNVLRGPLSPEQLASLGLEDAQRSLSAASKGELPVNFKLYESIEAVYNYGKSLPFGPYQE